MELVLPLVLCGGGLGTRTVVAAVVAPPTSLPPLHWQIGNRVNEAPMVLQREGRLFLLYSASLCWTPDYALGLLEFKVRWVAAGPLRIQGVVGCSWAS